jgi:hypothetical protein
MNVRNSCTLSNKLTRLHLHLVSADGAQQTTCNLLWYQNAAAAAAAAAAPQRLPPRLPMYHVLTSR